MALSQPKRRESGLWGSPGVSIRSSSLSNGGSTRTPPPARPLSKLDGRSTLAPASHSLTEQSRCTRRSEELRFIGAWWCAANYLSVDEIYLRGGAEVRPRACSKVDASSHTLCPWLCAAPAGFPRGCRGREDTTNPDVLGQDGTGWKWYSGPTGSGLPFAAHKQESAMVRPRSCFFILVCLCDPGGPRVRQHLRVAPGGKDEYSYHSIPDAGSRV